MHRTMAVPKTNSTTPKAASANDTTLPSKLLKLGVGASLVLENLLWVHMIIKPEWPCQVLK